MKPEDGLIFVEGIKQAPMGDGTQWLVDYLVERKDRVAQIVVDGKSGVGYLVDALRAEGVGKRILLTPSTDQAITAHSMLDRAVTQGEMAHGGDETLSAQADIAIRREIGRAGGFGWATEVEGETVALLEAVTLAFFGAKTTKRNPGRKQTFL